MLFFATNEPVYIKDLNNTVSLKTIQIISLCTVGVAVLGLITIIVCSFLLADEKYEKLFNYLFYIIAIPIIGLITSLIIIYEINNSSAVIVSSIDNLEKKYVDSIMQNLKKDSTSLTNTVQEKTKAIGLLTSEIRAEISKYENYISISQLLNEIDSVYAKISGGIEETLKSHINNVNKLNEDLNYNNNSKDLSSIQNIIQYKNLSQNKPFSMKFKLDLIEKYISVITQLNEEIKNIASNNLTMKQNPLYNSLAVDPVKFKMVLHSLVNNFFDSYDEKVSEYLSVINYGPFRITTSSKFLSNQITFDEFMKFYNLSTRPMNHNISEVILLSKTTGVLISLNSSKFLVLKYNQLLYVIVFRNNRITLITEGTNCIFLDYSIIGTSPLDLTVLKNPVKIFRIPDFSLFTYETINNNTTPIANLNDYSTFFLNNTGFSNQGFILKETQRLTSLPLITTTLWNSISLDFSNGRLSFAFEDGTTVVFEYLDKLVISSPGLTQDLLFSRLNDFAFQCNSLIIDTSVDVK